MASQLNRIWREVWQRNVLPETTLLVALCFIDTFLTLYLVRSGIAKEANPILRGSLAVSDTAFILLKGGTFLIPIAILEFIRSWRPQLVASAVRLGVFGYAAIYAFGTFALHGTI